MSRNTLGFLIALLLTTVAQAWTQPATFFCGTEKSIAREAGLAKASAASEFHVGYIQRVRGVLPILLVKFSFSDRAFSQTGYDDAMIKKVTDSIDAMYRNMSCGRLRIKYQIYPTILKLTKTASNYEAKGNSPVLEDDIMSAVNNTGYSQVPLAETYDSSLLMAKKYRTMVAIFPKIKGDLQGWGGYYAVRVQNLLVNGNNYTLNIVAHELGHSLGIPHSAGLEAGANVWAMPDSNNDVEYGNLYDIMGYGMGPKNHFSINIKNELGWTGTNEISTVTSTGTYRIYAHDNDSHLLSNRLIGVYVNSPNPKFAYWLEYRAAFPAFGSNIKCGDKFCPQGGGLIINVRDLKPPTWYLNRPRILDGSPDSRSKLDTLSPADLKLLGGKDFEDAVFIPGKKFQDAFGGPSFEVLGISQGTPNEDAWVDVKITFPYITQIRRANLTSPAGDAATRFDFLGRILPGARPTLTVTREGALRLAPQGR